MHGIGFITLTIRFNDDNAVTGGFAFHFGVGETVDQQEGADRAVADHNLAAVDYIFVSIPDCSGGRRGRIASGIRLGDGKAHQRVTLKQRR